MHSYITLSLRLATGEIRKRVEVGASLSGASELDMKVDSIMYSWLALYL